MLGSKGKKKATESGTGYMLYEDLAYLPNAEERQRLDVHVPDGEAPEGGWPLMLYAHPGGFIMGNKSDARGRWNFAIRAIDHGFALISANYRLLGREPENIELEIADIQAAMRWAVNNADALGINTSKIAYAGISAGGALVSAAAVRANKQGEPPAFAVVSFISPYAVTRVAQHLDKDDPPFYMVSGKMDTVVSHKQAEDFAAALDAVSVPYVLVTVGDENHPVDHIEVLDAYKALGKMNDPFIWLKGLLAEK